MSALGQKRIFGPFIAMSALPPIADITERDYDVRFVREAEVMPHQRLAKGRPFGK